MAKTGLFFGSFNPVHIGHMAIANYMVEFTDLDEIWFVVSPHNPFKNKKSLLDIYNRLELLHIAIDDDPRFKVTDIETHLPQPSFTIDTLVHLSEKHPSHDFIVIMGSDGLPTFNKWKNADYFITHFPRYIYPRSGLEFPYPNIENSQIIQAPLMDISASFIRKSIKLGKDVRYFMPTKVAEYVNKMNYYR